ncbi:hypothetical protein PoB_006292800 [Plakobranchus ocellatus]|uniref:Uncharacterized protein n=1 Tax=Plakobranchus ocellatus TaxID=259542 RepID=A0AAV4CX09_9GAST|nr:hypothetical protein PoB_006292800 [Plakobranchus ocellatus]
MTAQTKLRTREGILARSTLLKIDKLNSNYIAAEKRDNLSSDYHVADKRDNLGSDYIVAEKRDNLDLDYTVAEKCDNLGSDYMAAEKLDSLGSLKPKHIVTLIPQLPKTTLGGIKSVYHYTI